MQKSNQQKNSAKVAFGYEVKTAKNIKLIEKLSDEFTSADQRLAMGVTALISQPFFDIYNKGVDEDTRTVSCARTIGKIVAGSMTGVGIRWGCIKALDSFCKNKATEEEKAAKKGIAYTSREFSKREQCLLPKIGRDLSLKEVKRYKNAFGTFAATFIMIFTNFLIDAPLTTAFTNILTKKIKNTGKHNKESQKTNNIQKGES